MWWGCLNATKRVVLATAVCFYVLAGKDRDDECVRGRKAAGDRLEDIDLHDDSFIHEFSQIFGKTEKGRTFLWYFKNSIKYMLPYFHTLLGRSLKPRDASYTPQQFTQRCDKKCFRHIFTKSTSCSNSSSLTFISSICGNPLWNVAIWKPAGEKS